jgi:hypothetical protein
LILPVIGWSVGLILLWASDAWTTRQKLLGTLVIPGGLVVPVGLLFVGTSAETCTSTGDVPAGNSRVTCTGGSTWLEQALWLGLRRARNRPDRRRDHARAANAKAFRRLRRLKSEKPPGQAALQGSEGRWIWFSYRPSSVGAYHSNE